MLRWLTCVPHTGSIYHGITQYFIPWIGLKKWRLSHIQSHKNNLFSHHQKFSSVQFNLQLCLTALAKSSYVFTAEMNQGGNSENWQRLREARGSSYDNAKTVVIKYSQFALCVDSESHNLLSTMKNLARDGKIRKQITTHKSQKMEERVRQMPFSDVNLHKMSGKAGGSNICWHFSFSHRAPLENFWKISRLRCMSESSWRDKGRKRLSIDTCLAQAHK